MTKVGSTVLNRRIEQATDTCGLQTIRIKKFKSNA
jgi:hypothetical protein